jgi:hypothetical protein
MNINKCEPSFVLRDVLTRDIQRVGENKALGYILFRTIKAITSNSINEFCNNLKKNQSYIVLRKNQTCLRTGAVFVFDEQSMSIILKKYDGIMKAMKWKNDNIYVIKKIAKTWFDDNHVVIPMIRELFGDESWTPPSDVEIKILNSIHQVK